MDENAIPATPPGKEPEKYIRTFAGDVETLKGGGVPDLVPLVQPRPAPSERLVAASPLPPTPPTPSIIQTPVQEPSPVFTPPPVAPIKTYAGDFSERMKETRASAVTVLAAEQDSASGAPQAPEVPEKSSRSTLLYISAGVVLLIAGIAGTYIAYTRYLATSAPVMPVASVSAPIFFDEREQIVETGPALLKAIHQSAGRPFAPGNIRLLYGASSATKSVFSSLPLSAPDRLLRNVNVEGSMAGIVNAGGSQSPFFILSVSSYSNTFAGMLSWEAIMPRSLEGLFPAYPPVSVSTTTPPTATTTRAQGTQLGFHDEVVSNHDVRIYRDEAGRSVFLYGYWNQTTLVIARDPAAFTEILGRLATSRAQ